MQSSTKKVYIKTMSNTTTVQSVIDSNPKACWRTLEKKLQKALPYDFWRKEVTDLLIAARPLCNWDACDACCPYSGRCEG